MSALPDNPEGDPLSDTTPVVAPKLPLPLPEYHGQTPTEMKSTFSGLKDQLRRAHERGERIVSVVEWKVLETGHRETDDGVLYVESLKASEFYELEGDAGRRLLAHVRQHGRDADDNAAGREPLAVDGEDGASWGLTDESGVALTPADVEELRGDPVAALEDEGRTPVVVVYSDGERFLWPDEYPADTPRPSAGEESSIEDEHGVPTGAVVFVSKLLHHETGETIAEFTPEAQDARLAELEAEAETSEGAPAAGDAPLEPEVAEELREGLAAASEAAAGQDETEIPFLPGPDHFAFVDRKIEEIKPDVASLGGEAGRDFLLRCTKAEEQGRGRGLKPRSGVLELLEKRAGVIFLEGSGEPAIDPPAEPGDFGPPDGELEVDPDEIEEG